MAARNTILRPPRSRSLPSERLGPARCHVPDDLLFMHEKYPNDRRFMVGSERRQKKVRENIQDRGQRGIDFRTKTSRPNGVAFRPVARRAHLVRLWIFYALGGPKTPPRLRQSLRGSLPPPAGESAQNEASKGRLSRGYSSPGPRPRRKRMTRSPPRARSSIPAALDHQGG